LELLALPPTADASNYKYQVHAVRDSVDTPAHHLAINWIRIEANEEAEIKLF
jgi:hypothetical protein